MTVTVAETQGTIEASLILDAMVGRLTYDEEFAAALSKDPRQTLDLAGMQLDKESVEAFIKTQPERFDKVCDALARMINPDVLAAMSEPTCG